METTVQDISTSFTTILTIISTINQSITSLQDSIQANNTTQLEIQSTLSAIKESTIDNTRALRAFANEDSRRQQGDPPQSLHLVWAETKEPAHMDNKVVDNVGYGGGGLQ